MKTIDYACPNTVEEAVILLMNTGRHARALAGGTDIIVQVREGQLELDLLVDVKKIPEVTNLSYDRKKGLILGAAVPCYEICEHQEIAAAYPGLIDSASLVGGTAIQNRASFGGNLCNASPAADTVPSLIVYHSVCVIAGPQGRREVPVERFCTGPGKTVLQPGELLVSFRIPAPPRNFGAHYLRFIPRNEMDIAVVSAGTAVVLDDSRTSFVSGRVALGAVAPTPLLVEEASELLAGAPICDEVIEEVAEAARKASNPINDMRGTVEHRRHVARVLTRRTLSKAIQRVRGGSGE